MRTFPMVMAGVCALQLAAAPLLADDDVSRVRTSSTDVRRLIDEATGRSATIRALVAEIDRSDLIVYVRVRTFASTRLDGRRELLTVATDER
jgi:hypothetical protein